MNSGYYDEEIIETIEVLGYKYLINAKAYPTLALQITDESVRKLNTWNKDRIFAVSRVLKPEKVRAQLSLFTGFGIRINFLCNKHRFTFRKSDHLV